MFGVSPNKIELMTELKGVDFDDALQYAQIFVERHLETKFIHINHLIESKRAAGRPKDMEDINQLLKKME